MVRSQPAAIQRLARYLVLTAAALLMVLAYRRILHVNQTTVALSFLALVQLAAFGWGLEYSIYLSVFCTLLYNFFFLPPIGRFTIADPQNWIALLVFLAAAVFISRISESERRQTTISEIRRREMELLYDFSQQLLMDEQVHEVAHHAPQLIASIFAFPCVALYLAENDRVQFSSPGNEFVSIDRLRAVAQAPDAPRFPLQNARIVPLKIGLRANGAVAMIEADYSDGLYDAIGGLLAVALERAAALDRFARMEAAREGERLRSAVLDSITHELRTPLTAIRAAATSLLSQPALVESQRRELLSIVEEESFRLNRLLGHALEMARLESPGIQLGLRPLQMQDVIERALEESRAMLRGRKVSVDLPSDLPPVPMDGELLGRVFHHLLENAARYSPAGSPVRISARLEQNRLLVSVQDEGQGIDEAEQPLIFGRFFRGSRQPRQMQGTGMGLAIAKAIINAHKGGIDVISRPNQGSTFVFWIPARSGKE